MRYAQREQAQLQTAQEGFMMTNNSTNNEREDKMNLVNEGVLPPDELDDRDERREEQERARSRETVADIVADLRKCAQRWKKLCEGIKDGNLREALKPQTEIYSILADRIEAVWKREREGDKRLLFRLLWFDVDDYQSDWACNAYRQTVKDCCERLGIPYHQSGREIADEMDKKMLGKEVAKEVRDE